MSRSKFLTKAMLLGAGMAMFGAGTALAREQITIVGSSTVFPFSTTVADKFGKKTRFKTPKVVATGSGGGMKHSPDITNASRQMKAGEWKNCQQNGVRKITEVIIGFDGIVIANAKGGETFELSRKQLYLALAALVPGKDGKLVKNPYQKWSDIDAALPDTKIEVFGPPPTSGTRDAFEELALGGGAKGIGWLKTLHGLAKGDVKIAEIAKARGIPSNFLEQNGELLKGKSIFRKIAWHIRNDGPYIEAGENDNAIVGQLVANPNAIGVFGYSFLDQNRNRIKGAKIDGVAPDFDNIADGGYPVARSLFFYVKNAHVGKVPGIVEFISEFMSEDAAGEDGYLADKGLIPLPEDELEIMRERVTDFQPMIGELLN